MNISKILGFDRSETPKKLREKQLINDFERQRAELHENMAQLLLYFERIDEELKLLRKELNRACLNEL